MVRRLLRLIPVVLAMAVVAAGAALGFSGVEAPRTPAGAAVIAADPGASALTGTWAEPITFETPTTFAVARAVGDAVNLYTAPDVPDPVRPTMVNPTWEGLPLLFLVLDDDGPWLRVRVSDRPNSKIGWIEASEVTLVEVHNRMVIDLSDKRATVYLGDEVLLEETVAIGSDASPTPLGSFFVDGIVDLRGYPLGPYGAMQVSVSGFSERYQSFGGGYGQIALHGTNRPELLGQPVSNGCVRMTDEAIVALSALTPLGTPVEIVA